MAHKVDRLPEANRGVVVQQYEAHAHVVKHATPKEPRAKVVNTKKFRVQMTQFEAFFHQVLGQNTLNLID